MEFDVRQVLTMLKKRSRLIVGVAILVCGITAYYSLYVMQPSYEASARIIVNKKSDTAPAQQIDYNDLNANIKLTETYKQIIISSNVMSQVIRNHPELKISVSELLDNVSVRSVKDTQVMIISARDKSYGRAVNVVNAVTEAFQSKLPSIMKVDNVTILDEANSSPIHAPVSPNPALNVSLSLVLSLLLSLGFIFIREYMDDTFDSEEEIQRYLQIPAYGTIPTMKKKHFPSQKSQSAKREVGDTYASIST